MQFSIVVLRDSEADMCGEDTFHTTAQRMKYAGQTDPSSHNNRYAPNLAADGQGAFFSGETRPAVLCTSQRSRAFWDHVQALLLRLIRPKA